MLGRRNMAAGGHFSLTRMLLLLFRRQFVAMQTTMNCFDPNGRIVFFFSTSTSVFSLGLSMFSYAITISNCAHVSRSIPNHWRVRLTWVWIAARRRRLKRRKRNIIKKTNSFFHSTSIQYLCTCLFICAFFHFCLSVSRMLHRNVDFWLTVGVDKWRRTDANEEGVFFVFCSFFSIQLQ